MLGLVEEGGNALSARGRGPESYTAAGSGSGRVSGTPPTHWQSCQGPANWYTLSFPPSWELHEDEGIVELRPPGGGATLTLSCIWLGDDQAPDLASVVDVAGMFPRSRNVRAVSPPELPYRSLALEGRQRLERAGPWWKRWLVRPAWRTWRLWVFQQKSLCLVAAFAPTDASDPEIDTLARMIVGTLSLSDPPADPPQVFAERVLQLARDRFPLMDCRRCEDFQLQLGESNINLFNFYRSYVNSPERFEEIVLPALTTVVQVQEWGEQQTEPDFAEVRDRILPMLYPGAVWKEDLPDFVGVPWVGGLTILYVVDEARAYWYIRRDLLDNWNVTTDELHELALENLDAHFDENPMEFTLAGEEAGPRILMPNRPDAYNASRVLSHSFREELRQHLGSEFVTGLPGRDFFVAVSLDSDETVEQVRQKVNEDYARMDHPLSERLLLVSADGVSEFCE